MTLYLRLDPRIPTSHPFSRVTNLELRAEGTEVRLYLGGDPISVASVGLDALATFSQSERLAAHRSCVCALVFEGDRRYVSPDEIRHAVRHLTVPASHRHPWEDGQ